MQLDASGQSELWAVVNTIDGSDDGLYTTTDDGRHWHLDAGLGGYTVGAVSFSSPQDGVATIVGNGLPPQYAGVATYPTMMGTTDGGRTWAPQIIDGPARNQAGPLLATPSGAYAIVPTQGVRYTALFATTDGGFGGAPTALTLSLAHPTLTAGALKTAGAKVTVTGHVSPLPVSGAPVIVSYQVGTALWRQTLAPVTASGAFTAVLTHVTATTSVVAQSLGDGVTDGAGTPAQQLTVTH